MTLADVAETRPQAALSLIWHFMDNKYLCVWNRRYQGWGLPGGKVEPGEALADAQARELREETGLETKEATLIYSAPTVTSDSGRMVHIFRVIPTVGSVQTPFELEPGSPVDFRSREELLSDSPFKPFYQTMFEHFDRVAEARDEVETKYKADEEARRAKVAATSPSRPLLIASEHPVHICGRHCDGADGPSSRCARLRQKLGLVP